MHRRVWLFLNQRRIGQSQSRNFIDQELREMSREIRDYESFTQYWHAL